MRGGGGGGVGPDQQDHQSRLFYELCALLFSIIRSPETTTQSPPFTASSTSSTSPSPSPSPTRAPTTPISPAAFASLLLGISLALMLCGSVTFMIGFILMPWVMGLVMVLYLFGILSSVSGFGRSILGCNSSQQQQQPSMSPPQSSSRKGVSSEWKFL